ncbi:hypothetical protein DER44DRAFT_747114 [Fusarium oxysporum]|nr:hypothetical protein DER44DRAFT_747114 [Fusarium oxysporum]
MTAENAYISRRLAGHRLQTLVARWVTIVYMILFLIHRILIRYLIISPVHFDSPLLHHTFRNTRPPKLALIPSNFTSLVAANVSRPALIQSCMQLSNTIRSTPSSSRTVINSGKSDCLLNPRPGKLQLRGPSTSRLAWPGPFFSTKKASWASSFLLKKEVWRLKGQGGPYRPVSPDMFESNDYLRFDLEHPRQAAFVRVSVEDNVAKTGTAFKFACVEFRDSTSAKKYVANIKLKRS